MGFLVSPGVHVREIDLTNIIPAVSTSIAAIAGAFKKGPVKSVVTIGSEEDLLRIFGKPQNNSNQFETWFSAANFLQYGNALRVVRAESAVTNAIASGTSFIIRDDDHYEDSYADGQGSVVNGLLVQRAHMATALVFLFVQLQLHTRKLPKQQRVIQKH